MIFILPRGRARTVTVNSAASRRSIWPPARCYGRIASARPWSVRCWRRAGGLVFAGLALDRYFSAFDAATGKPLWRTQLNVVPNASPVTYSVQGEQYVAIVAGGGGPVRRRRGQFDA